MPPRSKLALLGMPLLLAALSLAAAARPPQITDVGRRIPSNVDLVVALDRGCVARQTASGRAVASIASAMADVNSADAAWSELATRLGRSRTQVFDELVGTRVVFVRRCEKDGECAWAIMSSVSLDTERRLRERLAVAPRKLVAGHAVMALEHGECELATERMPDGATILPAPSRAPALFNELLPTLAGGPASPLSADPRFASLESLGDGELLVYLRDHDARGAWFGAIAQTDGDVVNAGLRHGADELTGCDAGVSAWPRSMFDRLAEGALLAWIERPVAPRGRDSALGAILSQIPFLALGQERSALIGDRFTLIALDSPQGPSVAAALELRSASSAAPQIDRMLCGLCENAGLPGQDFKGLEPGAMRAVQIGQAEAIPPTLTGVIRGRPIMWSFPLSARPHPARSARGATMESIPDDQGWCVLGLGDTAYARAKSALTAAANACAPNDGPAPDAAPWVSMGMIRPWAALASLDRAGTFVPASCRSLGAIERAEWALRLGADNVMVGRASVQFVAPAAPGSPPAPRETPPPARASTARP